MDVNVASGSDEVTGSLMAYSYPIQTITLTCLNSDTTYNYCVIATNVTNMVQVGESVCGSFTTEIITIDNSDGRYVAKYIQLYIIIQLDFRKIMSCHVRKNKVLLLGIIIMLMYF